MREYCVVADGSSDLTVQELEELGVISVPIGLTIGPLTFPDEKGNYPPPDDLQKLLKSFAGDIGVSGLKVASIVDTLRRPLENGLDVLFMGIDTALSPRSQNAMYEARLLLESRFPMRRIEMLNMHLVASGLGLLVRHAAMLCNEGAILDVNIQTLENLSRRIVHIFTVSELKTLERSGAISKSAAKFGAIFNTMPLVRLTYGGNFEVVEKIRGDTQMLQQLVRQIASGISNKEGRLCIGYGDEEHRGRAEELERQVRLVLPVADISLHQIGPSVTAYAGPTVLAAFFVGARR